ncbi:rab-like protein 2B isoform X4 [Mustela putorius furo]|uniref:Rab-like protein 2B isoform X4 n=1 Tax=Mustela putorius furo TaxID=9669 RepID=A0A8U0SIL7_MUSPF|nr:rab-like protein 2B isoform X4 [Mustela putorius furo]
MLTKRVVSQEEEHVDLVEETSHLFNSSLLLIFPDNDKSPHPHTSLGLDSQEPMASNKAKPCELNQDKYDADDNVKIICLGDSAVGKSKKEKQRYSWPLKSPADASQGTLQSLREPRPNCAKYATRIFEGNASLTLGAQIMSVRSVNSGISIWFARCHGTRIVSGQWEFVPVMSEADPLSATFVQFKI